MTTQKQTVASTNNRVDTLETSILQLVNAANQTATRIDGIDSAVAQMAATVQMMATTVAGLEQKHENLRNAMVAGNSAPAPATPDPEPWLSKCRETATPAQRVEYEKLAAKARKQYDELVKVLGCKGIKCFIPVSETADKMPHKIQWSAFYK